MTEWPASGKYLKASSTPYWLQEENQALQLQNGLIKPNMGRELKGLKLCIGHLALLIFRAECKNNLPKNKFLHDWVI